MQLPIMRMFCTFIATLKHWRQLDAGAVMNDRLSINRDAHSLRATLAELVIARLRRVAR